jgi:hypothetical protein
MAAALDWDADRTRREVDAWHARVAGARAAEADATTTVRWPPTTK